MNHKIVIATLLLGISSLAVAAQNEPIKACELLQAKDLAPWGYGAHPQTTSDSKTVDKAKVDAESDVQTDICYLKGESVDHQGASFVVVESFSQNLGAEAMASWLKIVSAKAKDEDIKVDSVQIGDTTCETGKYTIPMHHEVATQYYVACDRLVGARHLTINMQQAEADKLPTPPQVRELLNQVAARLELPALK